MSSEEEDWPSKDLYGHFCSWCEGNKRKTEMTAVSFAIHVKKWLGNSTDDNQKAWKKGERRTVVNKARVIDVFKARNLFEDEYF